MAKKIYIELATRKLFLKINQQTLSSYPVAIGKPATPTPTGDFQVLYLRKNPGGVLGTRWIQFTWQSHGIHGTNAPSSIGQAVSLGCVRMFNHHVNELYNHVNLGMSIIIRTNLQQVRNPGNTGNRKNHIIYTVKRGDSLWKISRKYNVSIETIMNLNNLQDTIIYPGQKLKIPR